jgi:hypothetical protein
MRHPSRARSLAVGSLSLVSLFGCASIIGLDDYTVAKPGGHAGAAAGPSEEAGASGEAGTSGRGGAPHSGEGGEAGLSAPAVVGCDGVTTFEPNPQVVTSCIVRAGCNPNFDPVRNISTCVTFDTQQALPGENCTRNATTCAEYQECEHVGIAGSDLCGGSKVTRCEGNQAVNCDNYKVDQFSDCDALGGTCATFDYNGVTFADCKLDVSPDTNCVGQTDDSKYFCHSSAGKDDLRYYCWKGQAYGSSCSSLAYCDGDQAAGKSTCYYNLPKCSGSSVSCKNNIANVCSNDSLFKYDCGAVGLSCGVTAGAEYCLAPGCKVADAKDCTESCSADGSQLTFCYGGAPFTVDCADYGFAKCASDVDDQGVTFAACRF